MLLACLREIGFASLPVVHILLPTTKRPYFCKSIDRNGRCIATLLESTAVRG